MSKINPCPACKSQATLWEYLQTNPYYWVQCTNCRTRGPDHHDKVTAVWIWNHSIARKEETSEPDK